jgi:hypothetical protein
MRLSLRLVLLVLAGVLALGTASFAAARGGPPNPPPRGNSPWVVEQLPVPAPAPAEAPAPAVQPAAPDGSQGAVTQQGGCQTSDPTVPAPAASF